MLGVVAMISGTLGLVLAPSACFSGAIVLAAAVVVGVLAFRDQDKTSVGEAIAGAVLAGASAPVGAAMGIPTKTALVTWAIWAFAFVISTFAVRALTTKNANEKRALHAIVLALCSCAVAAIAAGIAIVTLAAPIVLVALALVLARPNVKYVRHVGWALAASTTITAIAIVVHAR
jgi:hypothetical protein